MSHLVQRFFHAEAAAQIVGVLCGARQQRHSRVRRQQLDQRTELHTAHLMPGDVPSQADLRVALTPRRAAPSHQLVANAHAALAFASHPPAFGASPLCSAS